jgi:succinate dehydrogenase hydrophobic anchor subunit
MIIGNSENGFNKGMTKLLDIIPPLAGYARNRGVPYLISWGHRLSGTLMVLFIGFHIFTLSFLSTPDAYTDKMKLYSLPALAFLEWALAIPVIFHALNGGRLILYESFGCRRDDLMLKWVAGLTILYAGILAVLILIGNQSVSPAFFWFLTISAALTAAYGLYARIRDTRHAISWKIQRITGAFLFVMIPAHFIFMHLNPQVSGDAGQVTIRMQSIWIKLVDTVLVASALYHGGYGLLSILNDYTASKKVRTAGTAAVTAAMAAAAWFGIKLILLI